MENSDGDDSVAHDAADAKARVKDAAGSVMQRGKELAGEAASKGAQRASSAAETTASALRRAADDVEGENHLIGVALRKSAESLEKAAHSLQGGDISSVVENLNGFARRQPALFLGASVALGFALARVGKTAMEQSGVANPSAGNSTAMPEI